MIKKYNTFFLPRRQILLKISRQNLTYNSLRDVKFFFIFLLLLDREKRRQIFLKIFNQNLIDR